MFFDLERTSRFEGFGGDWLGRRSRRLLGRPFMIRNLVRRMITNESSKINELNEKIKMLESRLAGLTASAPIVTGVTGSNPRKLRRVNTSKREKLGPLPAVLANAPKRHVAFLFSCEFATLSLGCPLTRCSQMKDGLTQD